MSNQLAGLRAARQGSLGSGSGHWRIERLSALALVPLLLWMVFSLLALPDASYATLHQWIAAGLHPVLLCLILIATVLHSWLGTRVIVEDYVHAEHRRETVLLLLSAIHIGLIAVGLYAVLRVAFQGDI